MHVTQAVPKHDAREREEDGRAVREVGEHECVGDTAVLVEDDEVGDPVRAASVGELLHDVVSAVDASRVGEAEAHFLQREESARVVGTEKVMVTPVGRVMGAGDGSGRG